MRVAAVDLGATSARVAVVDSETSSVDVVHRYAHQPVQHADGSLRWDWARLMAEVARGLEIALERGINSIGVDTWGVDYGLLDTSGELVAPPFSYRDSRTDGWREIAARLGEERLYRTTGVQLMPINTVFQLAVHDRDELARATRLLMLPELVVHHLTGAITGETTSAGTSALVSLDTSMWAHDLLHDIDVPASLFPTIATAGTRVGEWRGVPVHLVGGHDTASAADTQQGARDPSTAFVATGTWVLVGTHVGAPVRTEAARAANFSNERTPGGGYRLVKNITGLWLLEQCREAWGNPPVDELVVAADGVHAVRLIDPDDPAFTSPAAIGAAIGVPPTETAVITRCIIDSIAARVAVVTGQLADVTGTPVDQLFVFGGGTQNVLLVRQIGAATGLPTTLGSAEATALGNALQQFNTLTA